MRINLLAVLLVLGSNLPVIAQQAPALEGAGGYSFLRDQEIEENLHGWLASVGGNVTPWFGVVGEVGGNYKTLQVLGTDVNLSVHSFMAGPRFAVRANPNVTPFGQVLFGGVRGSGSVLGISESSTEFAIQPGGGVDFWLQPNFGIRAGADYRRIFAEGDGTNEFRLHVGVVVATGMR